MMMMIYLAGMGLALHAVLIFILFVCYSEYVNNDDIFICKVFGFGVVKAKSDRWKHNLNLLRKTENKVWFIDAPNWFNRYIYNFGVKK